MWDTRVFVHVSPTLEVNRRTKTHVSKGRSETEEKEVTDRMTVVYLFLFVRVISGKIHKLGDLSTSYYKFFCGR